VLASRRLDARVVEAAGGTRARVRYQAPKGGVAAAPGMDVKLVLSAAAVK
jgi:hypothetical protein